MLSIFGGEIKDYFLSSFFNRYIITSDEHKDVMRQAFKHIKAKAAEGSIISAENDRELISTGMIYTLSPPMAFKASGLSCSTNVICLQDVEMLEIWTSREHFGDVLDVFSQYNYHREHFTDFFTFEILEGKQNWSLLKRIPRNNPPIFYQKNFLKSIYTTFDAFLRKKEDYIASGINYKLCIIFHGKSGTGKSTMVKHLAEMYDRNIYYINPSDFFEKQLNGHILRKVCGEIVLCEDIDKFLYKRHKNMSGVLNMLDGIGTQENVIYILTAESVDAIPASLCRDGRIDRAFEFPMADVEILDQIGTHFGSQMPIYGVIEKSTAEVLSMCVKKS